MSPKYQHNSDNSPVPDITDEEMRRTVVAVRRDLTEIKVALMGNDMGTLGIIPRLILVEKQSAMHEKQHIIWGAYIVAVQVGLGIFAKLFHFI